MADQILGIAPQKKTHAEWVIENPTLGKDVGADSFGQIVLATGSPVGDIMVWGNAETYNTAYAAGQYYAPAVDAVTVTASATVGGEAVVNVNTGTATITIPAGLAVGTRKLIRKISATAGTVTIARSSTDTFTRAALTSVTLTSDGDFWLLEKVSSTRWDLVDGHRTGGASGYFYAYPDGRLSQYIYGVTMTRSTTSRLFYDWNYPVEFVDTNYSGSYIIGAMSLSDAAGFNSSQWMDTVTTSSARFSSISNSGYVAEGDVATGVRIEVHGRWYA